MDLGQRLKLTEKYLSADDIRWGLEHDVLNPEQRDFLEARLYFLTTPAVEYLKDTQVDEALRLLEELVA